MNFFLPTTEDDNRLTLLLFVHGGGLNRGDRHIGAHEPTPYFNVDIFAAQDYAVAKTDRRLT